ncbi:MAG: hypothetical protein IPO41_12825 [Acidobacteria bacterium]|nr:hypothetical protein [Acidobacteriota bacterium]
MKNRTNTRKCGRTNSFFSAKTLLLAGFAVMIVLGLSSLAFFTQTASMQDIGKTMPSLNTNTAVHSLENKEGSRSPLVDATCGDEERSVRPVLHTLQSETHRE